MSLFDPQNSKEILDVLLSDRTQGSGETVREPSHTLKKQLEAELLRIGAKMARSGDKQAGFEEAYSAFADTFQQIGATLTESLLQIDIPNMLFNFALKSGWFPHLGCVDRAEVLNITSPKRINHDDLSVRGGVGGLTVPDKRQSIGWFKDQIRPAILQWRAKAIELSAGALDGQRQQEPSPIVVSRREKWLKAELEQRGWSTGDLERHTGPNHKTTESYLKGGKATFATRKKLLDALNQKLDGRRKLDISEVPE